MTPEEIMELEGWTAEQYKEYDDALHEMYGNSPVTYDFEMESLSSDDTTHDSIG